MTISEVDHPSWLVIGTDSKGRAVEHLLARRRFLTLMSEHMGQEMTSWIQDIGLLHAMTEHFLEWRETVWPDLTRYHKDGVKRGTLTEVVSHCLQYSESELLQLVRPLRERCELPQEWDWVLIDHLGDHALGTWTEVPSLYLGEQLVYCHPLLLSPRSFGVARAPDESDEAYLKRVEAELRCFAESHSKPVPKRGRVPKKTEGSILVWTEWFYRVRMQRTSQYRLAQDLSEEHKHISYGIRRIDELLKLIGYPIPTDRSRGFFSIETSIDLSDEGPQAFYYSSLA